MASTIRRVAIVGAGWMGSSLAAFFASVGLETTLLGILPNEEPTTSEQEKGITNSSSIWRNKEVTTSLERAYYNGAFLDPDAFDSIRCGNIIDNLSWLENADWVIESVVEDKHVKKAVYDRILPHIGKDTIISSNTSGIPLAEFIDGRSEDFARHFLLTHFFNPVRQMKLVEIVTSQHTEKAVVSTVSELISDILGKRIIAIKDDVQFVANRIGMHALLNAMKTAFEMGINIVEADIITGSLLGRSSSGVFLTADIVGLDSLIDAAMIQEGMFPDDPFWQNFKSPKYLDVMIRSGNLGKKVGRGFYKDTEMLIDEPTLTISFDTFQYQVNTSRKFDSVENARKRNNLVNKIKTLVFGDDPASEYAWVNLRDNLIYACNMLGVITDDPVTIDRAMRWGYNWKLGPFQLWDALGVEKVIRKMEEDSIEIPEAAKTLIDSGNESWYEEQDERLMQFVSAKKSYDYIQWPAGVVRLEEVKRMHGEIKKDEQYTLLDIGEGIACLSLDPIYDIDMVTNEKSCEILEEVIGDMGKRGMRGLLIYSEGRDFSWGLDLSMILELAENKAFDKIEKNIIKRQEVNQLVKQCRFPIVAVPVGKIYGSGLEMSLHCSMIQANSEIRIGFNELDAGLVPSGGGCKEMIYSAMEKATNDGPFPVVNSVFNTMFPGKIARGVFEAKRAGFLRKSDRFTMGFNHLLSDAKNLVIDMIQTGYAPRMPQPMSLPGLGGAIALQQKLEHMQRMGEIGDHGMLIGQKLANIFTGGNCSPHQMVNEKVILELEREAFLQLCGTKETQERIKSLIFKGYKLNN